MKRFVELFDNIVKEAEEFIKESVLKQGKIEVVKLDEDGEVDEKHEDFFYEAPCVGTYDEGYDEYAIMSLEARDGEVIVKTRGRFETGGEREFTLEDIDPENTAALADLIQE
jgi:hypothetical protein